MNLSLRNRIAFFYISVTAAITFLLFFVIYSVVHKAAYDSIDDRLDFEAADVIDDIDTAKDFIFFTDTSEWTEQEHKAVEVFPTFIEVADNNGKIIRKTSNLKDQSLTVNPDPRITGNSDSRLSDKEIRQKQAVIMNNKGKIIGYLVIAMPLEGTTLVVENLRIVLIYSYPVVLLTLFLISRAIAGRSIKPLLSVTKDAESITRENLGGRISFPSKKDEIYDLSVTVNSLLDRLEDAVLREKQFTADASHELRTPLAIIKGTLEVLIRKPRDTAYYESKISYCISEADRISSLIDQLLMLARYESGSLVPIIRKIDLDESLHYCILRLNEYAADHGIKIKYDDRGEIFVKADASMLDLMLENLISNSIKYSGESKEIEICVKITSDVTSCCIIDGGIGMKEEQLARIFDRFYRSEEARNSQIGGHGIGLAIVKRLADVQNISINFESKPLKGTTATLKFHS